jgi:hypothetical protein
MLSDEIEEILKEVVAVVNWKVFGRQWSRFIPTSVLCV